MGTSATHTQQSSPGAEPDYRVQAAGFDLFAYRDLAIVECPEPNHPGNIEPEPDDRDVWLDAAQLRELARACDSTAEFMEKRAEARKRETEGL